MHCGRCRNSESQHSSIMEFTNKSRWIKTFTEPRDDRSMTIQGQALTMREVLQNFITGRPINEYYRQGYYEEEPIFDNPINNTFVDPTEISEELEIRKTLISQSNQIAKDSKKETPIEIVPDTP